MTKQSTNSFWTGLGKISAILGIVWILFQIINKIIEDDGYEIKTTAYHSNFNLPPDYLNLLDEYEKITDLDKSYSSVYGEKSLSIPNLKEFSETTKDEKFLRIYQSLSAYDDIKNLPPYNSTWVFNIENTGRKPIEQIILETPFSGIYKIQPKNGKVITGKFNKTIILNDLNPGHNLGIRIWIESSQIFEYFDEEKTRITHKYGYQQFEYSASVTGFAKWVFEGDGMGLLIFCIVLFVVFLIIFLFGNALGIQEGIRNKSSQSGDKLTDTSQSSENKETS